MDEDYYGLDTTCPGGITPKARSAYSAYVVRFRKGMPGSLTAEEAEILDKFCGGDLKKLDRFFAEHRKDCPYCNERLERSFKAEDTCFDGDKGLALRLEGDLFIEDGIDITKLRELSGRVREARKTLEETHAQEAKKFIDYYGRWIDGKIDPKDTSVEHLQFRQHICSCPACRGYFNALSALKDHKL